MSVETISSLVREIGIRSQQLTYLHIFLWKIAQNLNFTTTTTKFFKILSAIFLVSLFSVLLSLFFLSIVIHIFANIKAVKAVHLRTFNESRYLIALEEYFRSSQILSIANVNCIERVTIGRAVSVSLNIRVGLSIQHLIEQYRITPEIEVLVGQFDKTNEKFIIAESTKFLGIYLHTDAQPIDVLKAYFYAVSYLQDRTQLRERFWEVQSKWNEFLAAAQHERWAFDSHLIHVDEYRIEWRM